MVAEPTAPTPRAAAIDLTRLPLWVALAILAIPTGITLGQQVWSRESGAHGPIVLFTGAWLIWRQLDVLRAVRTAPNRAVLAIGAVVALAIYVFGRAYDYISLEALGLYLFGLIIFYGEFGKRAMLKSWFPLFYFGFLVPAPGWFMDRVTAPLKMLVSQVAAGGMHLVGLPIYRQGVTLYVGRYELLVEDACAGLNSINGLVAISLFYIYLLRNASLRYAAVLAALVLPIAIVANIIRICILVLLTYFFGDAVAQGFLHFTAGIILFGTSLLLIFALDGLLSKIWRVPASRIP